MPHKNLNACNNCGICNAHCPSYLASRKETASPRHLVNLARRNRHTTEFFMHSSECSCLKSCPAGVEIDHLHARAELVRSGVETEANAAMKQNMLKFGTPTGPAPKQKHKKN